MKKATNEEQRAKANRSRKERKGQINKQLRKKKAAQAGKKDA